MLEVSRSGYYKWLSEKANLNRYQVRREALLARTSWLFHDAKKRYG
ncbi:hypothetical protein ACFPYJ_01665 [Paenibacillus solisilvae]|uniref:Transposase n=1 Tax=Paenibacillus solisilvae TaxID=2486751 RepID=A0ABW0VQ11_9BACL